MEKRQSSNDNENGGADKEEFKVNGVENHEENEEEDEENEEEEDEKNNEDNKKN